jgi:hypothetical protein
MTDNFTALYTIHHWITTILNSNTEETLVYSQLSEGAQVIVLSGEFSASQAK